MKNETGIQRNLPKWESASSVYSKAYKYMEEHGPDYSLIEALQSGDEETIKANMLRINTDNLFNNIP